MDSGVATIVAAVIALGTALLVAVLQLTALEQQNRIAAFDKRFAVFESLDAAIYELCKHNKPSIDGLMAFNRAMRELYFLFPRSLHTRLSDVRKQSVTMVGLYHEIWDSSGNAGEGYTNENLEKFHTAQLKLVQTWEQLSKLFRPHMALTKR